MAGERFGKRHSWRQNRWRGAEMRLPLPIVMKKKAKSVWTTPKLREIQIFFEVSLYTARR